mgnify:CR=1 FL=1
MENIVKCKSVTWKFNGLREEFFFLEIMHFHDKNPCSGGHEIYSLVDPSLVIITIHSVCLIYAWE